MHFSFNLNYFRPDYFGQEAFIFIDDFIEKLGLYVSNPQSDGDPYRPKKSTLYRNWSDTNARNCQYFFKEYNLLYFALEKSNYVYNYRKSRAELWKELGDDYYVSKLYIDETLSDRKVITLALLPLECAVVVPKADFYLMTKVQKKWFKTIEEKVLISHDTFSTHISHLFEDYKFPDSKILRLDKVAEAQKLYNKTSADFIMKNYCQRAEVQKLSNYSPPELGILLLTTLLFVLII
jgi:hypothetical protein